MGIAIGLGVGMTLLVSGLFMLISFPLGRLARAMQLLTKLDFGALEKGNVLAADSFITEVSNDTVDSCVRVVETVELMVAIFQRSAMFK